MIDQALRLMLRDEIREAMADERRAIIEAVVAEVRRLQEVDLLTTAEAAAIARVKTKTIRRWVDEGKLSRVHAGSDLRIHRGELLSFLGCSTQSDEVKEDGPLTDDDVAAIAARMRGTG